MAARSPGRGRNFATEARLSLAEVWCCWVPITRASKTRLPENLPGKCLTLCSREQETSWLGPRFGRSDEERNGALRYRCGERRVGMGRVMRGLRAARGLGFKFVFHARHPGALRHRGVPRFHPTRAALALEHHSNVFPSGVDDPKSRSGQPVAHRTGVLCYPLGPATDRGLDRCGHQVLDKE